jgi:septation ring formation regulator EzrA
MPSIPGHEQVIYYFIVAVVVVIVLAFLFGSMLKFFVFDAYRRLFKDIDELKKGQIEARDNPLCKEHSEKLVRIDTLLSSDLDEMKENIQRLWDFITNERFGERLTAIESIMDIDQKRRKEDFK